MKEKKVIVNPEEKIVVAMMSDFPKNVVKECMEKCNYVTAEVVRDFGTDSFIKFIKFITLRYGFE